jgi:Uma2 family endonuclease
MASDVGTLDFDDKTDRDVLTRDELRAFWHRLAADPKSPDRYELTEHGELIVGQRPTNRHQTVASVVASQVQQQLVAGQAMHCLSVITPAGVRVPDVAWVPDDRRAEVLQQDPLERCLPFVAEVLSPGNLPFEVNHKAKAYLAAGAQEVLVVGLKGQLSFRRADGAHATSALGLRLELPSDWF